MSASRAFVSNLPPERKMAPIAVKSEIAPGFSSYQEEALLTLMRAADALHRDFQKRLRPYGLSQTQFNVLRILRGARPNGLTCTAIGLMMITTDPDITRLLARLKTQNLLSQQRDLNDRRVLWTHISEHGLEILAQLDGIVEDIPRELFSELTCGEVQELTQLLNKALGRHHRSENSEATAPRQPTVTVKLPSPLRPLLRPHPE